MSWIWRGQGRARHLRQAGMRVWGGIQVRPTGASSKNAARDTPLDDQRQVGRERRKPAAASRLHAAAAGSGGAIVVQHLRSGPPDAADAGRSDCLLQSRRQPGKPNACHRFAAHHCRPHRACPSAHGSSLGQHGIKRHHRQHGRLLCMGTCRGCQRASSCFADLCKSGRGCRQCSGQNACTAHPTAGSGQQLDEGACPRPLPQLTSAPPSLAVTTLLPPPAGPLPSAPSSGAAPMYAAADESFSFCRLDWTRGAQHGGLTAVQETSIALAWALVRSGQAAYTGATAPVHSQPARCAGQRRPLRPQMRRAKRQRTCRSLYCSTAAALTAASSGMCSASCVVVACLYDTCSA